MKRTLLVVLPALICSPVAAKPSLVCQISARVPYGATTRRDAQDTRIFVQNSSLVEERRSGTSATRLWTVIGETQRQLVATDAGGAHTLVIDWSGATFAESGLLQQQRGYCRVNELP